jgi:hypothetical protein
MGEDSIRCQPLIVGGASLNLDTIGVARSKISRQVMDGYCNERSVSWSTPNPQAVRLAIMDGTGRERLGQLQYLSSHNQPTDLDLMSSLFAEKPWQPEGDR